MDYSSRLLKKSQLTDFQINALDLLYFISRTTLRGQTVRKDRISHEKRPASGHTSISHASQKSNIVGAVDKFGTVELTRYFSSIV